MIVALAIGVSACVVLPVAAVAGAVRLGYKLWQGRRLDRAGGGR